MTECKFKHKHTKFSQYLDKKINLFLKDEIDEKNAVPIFTLNDRGNPRQEEVRVTYEDLYCAKVQWFEPACPNYYHLSVKSVLPNLRSIPNLKHFTWQEVTDFADQNREMIEYRSGGKGDFKYVKCNGFALITVDGRPYWHDAVGQIPFAVNCYKYVAARNQQLAKLEDKETFIRLVLGLGQKVSRGAKWQALTAFLATNKEVINLKLENQYDNYFVLRGALWAAERYDVTKPVSSKKGEIPTIGKARIVNARTEVEKTPIYVNHFATAKNHPAEKLAIPISEKQAVKYKLK